MEFRLAVKEDFKQYLITKKGFFENYGISEKSKEFILKEFNKLLSKGAIILAVENSVVGYLAGEIEDSSYERVGYISKVFVTREYRNKGISTKLKDKFLEFLRKKKIKICRLEVSLHNPAKEVYSKWGFKVDKYRMSLDI